MKFTRKPDDQDTQGGGGTPGARTPLPLQSGAPKDVPPAMPRRSTPTAPSRPSEFGGERNDERQISSYGTDNKKLVVGREIALSGQISSCEKLVVEGRVEADIDDCRELEIADGGTFKGAATVEVAEIGGNFEGSLTATDLLIIRATGRLSGSAQYGRLEVERGGEISGDVKAGGAGSAG